MPSLYFDKSGKGHWCAKWYAGPGAGWKKAKLCRHPTPWQADRPPKKPPEEARRLFATYEVRERRARAGEAQPAGKDPSLAVWVDRINAEAVSGMRPASAAVIGYALGRLVEYAAERKILTPRAFTPAEARSFLAWLTMQPVRGYRGGGALSTGTVRAYRAKISHAFSIAEDEGLVDRNPFAKARVRSGKKEGGPPAAWSPAEIAMIMEHADPEMRRMIILGVHTGLRLSAMLGLRWEHVQVDDQGHGRIIVPAELSKSGRSYVVPLAAAAAATLADLAGGPVPPAGLVFPGRRPGKPLAKSTVYYRLQRAVTKAGLGPTRGQRLVHKLRHTFATWAANTPGIPLPVVQRWLGHSTITMTARYVHGDLEGDRAMTGFSPLALPTPGPEESEPRMVDATDVSE